MHLLKCKFHKKPLCWACLATFDPAFPVTHYVWGHILLPAMGLGGL